MVSFYYGDGEDLEDITEERVFTRDDDGMIVLNDAYIQFLTPTSPQYDYDPIRHIYWVTYHLTNNRSTVLYSLDGGHTFDLDDMVHLYDVNYPTNPRGSFPYQTDNHQVHCLMYTSPCGEVDEYFFGYTDPLRTQVHASAA